ncbi:MAG: zinc-binding dehydrogenase [Chloroflexi bacterium]|nr:zinc-binding dehydrogenase [Chloroflexota bacterium]
MKALRFHEYGGPEKLRYEDVEDPELLPDGALIRVQACAVNHLDLDLRAGTSRIPLRLPHILGREIAGHIVALGKEARGLQIGDRVLVTQALPCGHCLYCQTGRDNICANMQLLPGIDAPGGYAEYVSVPVSALFRIPASLSYDQAAAFQLAFGTAWHMLIARGGLRAGQTVLINAAGSGIGSAAVQIAKLAGAWVIASAGSEAKLQKARQYGADDAINYRESDLAKEVLRLTGGRGVDVVFEHVGGEIFLASLACLTKDGTMAVCGAHAGEVVPLDIIQVFRKEAKIIGSYAGTSQEITMLLNLAAQGRLKPVIHRCLPLEQAAEAHRTMAAREHFGKIILNP